MARVLIADDEDHLRALVVRWLQRAGHSVIEAADGVTAMETIDREKPDLVLLDTRMPGLDGFRVYDQLQASPAGNDIPVLFLAVRSADAALWEQHEGPHLSRIGRPYLVKPFSRETLVDAVERGLLRDRETGTPLTPAGPDFRPPPAR